jgi:DNA-binding NtrC family response regulator
MQHLKILIADADIEARDQLAAIISAARPDARLRFAETGRDLFRILQEETFDMLFLDMVLPYTDVAKLKDVIALMHARNGTRLVLVSETLRKNWTMIALALQAYEVLMKPYRPHAVTQLLRTYQQVRRTRQALIVDPSVRTRGILRNVLERSQFRLQPIDADSGRRAIRHTRQQDFEIAFVSRALFDMPALEAACQLLSRSGDRISVVLMDRAVDEAHRAFELFGIKDVMIQPFDTIDVNRTLHGALGLWRPYLVNALAAERARQREQAAPAARRA